MLQWQVRLLKHIEGKQTGRIGSPVHDPLSLSRVRLFLANLLMQPPTLQPRSEPRQIFPQDCPPSVPPPSSSPDKNHRNTRPNILHHPSLLLATFLCGRRRVVPLPMRLCNCTSCANGGDACCHDDEPCCGHRTIYDRCGRPPSPSPLRSLSLVHTDARTGITGHALSL